MAKLTAKIGGCAGKDCPAIWQTDDPAYLAVQGARMPAGDLEAAGQIPGDETIVLIPASLLDGPVSGQR